MDFEIAWKEQQTEKNLEETKKFWDNRASEFNEVGKNHHEDDEVIKMLLEKGAIFKGAKILDIGCGAGRYAKSFLKLGCQVTGIDISPCMIDFSKENAADYEEKNFSFKVISWEEADLKKERWQQQFDLVFASMSPAISGPEALKKMINASRVYCFMSSHLYKRDQLGQELKKVMDGKSKKGNSHQNLYYAFNLLWKWGYYPEFGHADFHREKTWETDKAIDYYRHMLKIKDEKTEKILVDYIEKKSVNGLVKDRFDTKNGWLFWSVTDTGGQNA